jgi:hypothetical protein
MRKQPKMGDVPCPKAVGLSRGLRLLKYEAWAVGRPMIGLVDGFWQPQLPMARLGRLQALGLSQPSLVSTCLNPAEKVVSSICPILTTIASIARQTVMDVDSTSIKLLARRYGYYNNVDSKLL